MCVILFEKACADVPTYFLKIISSVRILETYFKGELDNDKHDEMACSGTRQAWQVQIKEME